VEYQSGMKKWVKISLVSLGFFISAGALVLVYSQLKKLNYIDVLAALRTIPTFKVVAALLLSSSYYLVLGGYDIVAFEYIKPENSPKPKNILFACFISNALGSNTGYSMLFGGSIRYRLYSVYDVSMLDVTKILIFSSVTIWIGLLSIGGLVFTFMPISLKGCILNSNFSTRIIGLIFVTILILYVILSAFYSKSIKIFKWTINLPSIKIVFLQLLLATCDWLIASLTLYIFLPVGKLTYFVFLKVFLISQFLGIISQVPGGIGVFEASISLMLPSYINNPDFIAGLLAYRVVFYFFPLLIALILLVCFEVVVLVRKFKNNREIFDKSVSSLLVRFVKLSPFLLGIILMFLLLLMSLLMKNISISKIVAATYFSEYCHSGLVSYSKSFIA
jgi:uncharacterized membrane protein YbhN (UPF0104 family)